MKHIFAFMLTLVACSLLYGQEMDIIVSYDSFTGDPTAIIQYTKNGKTELIRGHFTKPSSDNNISVVKRFSGEGQQFTIDRTSSMQAQIWIANSFADDDLFDESMMTVLQESEVVITVNDHKNRVSHKVTIPDEPGMIFLAGTISDGAFYPTPRMFPKLRVFQLNAIDAVNGTPMKDVKVDILFKGSLTTSAYTDSKGEVSVQLHEYGDYKAIISKEDYVETEYTFRMDLNEIPTLLRVPLTQKMKEIRIVLTWGNFPSDLDAHLAGPKPEGGNFHLWWANKVMVGGRNFLDRDDTNGYGPETMTIYVPAKGIYKYAVHNYTQRTSGNSTGLSGSQARVDVFSNGILKNSFYPDPGKTGTVWHVFNIAEDFRIVPVNGYYHESDSKNILK
ncbi:MAG TPA: hypothetical protein ENO01_01305 [Candidatus Marinimicrobia bacterium]|nr:hypothetical protein [Candidatus Neomarinimicrobiota bacterium]